jgi:hypothetical protein
LVPARVATGQVYGPINTGGASPNGPQRHFAPLAQIADGAEPTDLRTLFTHLAWPNTPQG